MYKYLSFFFVDYYFIFSPICGMTRKSVSTKIFIRIWITLFKRNICLFFFDNVLFKNLFIVYQKSQLDDDDVKEYDDN